jgi:hypothetical protein
MLLTFKSILPGVLVSALVVLSLCNPRTRDAVHVDTVQLSESGLPANSTTAPISHDEKIDTIYLNPDSLKEFRIPEAHMIIRYPTTTIISNPKVNTYEPGRAGSFLAIHFNENGFAGKNCFFQEMLFHSLQSCARFTERLRPEEIEGDFFPEEWYHPEQFTKQRKILEGQLSDNYYELITMPSGRKCLRSHSNTFIFFQDTIRIMAYGEVNDLCDSTLLVRLLENLRIETTN